MSLDDAPLTLDRIVSAAEDVIRRFGPAKATVVDVARSLGVSHAAVYRHVATKAELQNLVVGRWVETTMPELRAIAAKLGPAPERLRQLFAAQRLPTPASLQLRSPRVGVSVANKPVKPMFGIHCMNKH